MTSGEPQINAGHTDEWAWSGPSSPLPASVDVVIIGGGIVGCSAAYFLARSGVSVLLCEKGRIAGEQSGRNWGWVRQQGRSPVELPMMMRSLRIWQSFERELQEDVGFTQGGSLYLAETSEQLESFRAWLAIAREHGLDTRHAHHARARIDPALRSESLGRRDVYRERCACRAQSCSAGNRPRRNARGRTNRQQLRGARARSNQWPRPCGHHRTRRRAHVHGCLRRGRLDQPLLPVDRCHGAATARQRHGRAHRAHGRNTSGRSLVARRSDSTPPRWRVHGGARIGTGTSARTGDVSLPVEISAGAQAGARRGSRSPRPRFSRGPHDTAALGSRPRIAVRARTRFESSARLQGTSSRLAAHWRAPFPKSPARHSPKPGPA